MSVGSLVARSRFPASLTGKLAVLNRRARKSGKCLWSAVMEGAQLVPFLRMWFYERVGLC